MMRYSNLELWQFIQKHPDFYNYVGTENDLRDQSGANPIIINLKKGHWYDKSRGEGGELSELVENLEFPPEQLSIDENAFSSILSCSGGNSRFSTSSDNSPPSPLDLSYQWPFFRLMIIGFAPLWSLRSFSVPT